MTQSDQARESFGRMMWITPDRVFYVGLLGAPTERVMGSLMVYVAVEGSIRVSLGDGLWQETEMAVVPPYLGHKVLSDAREISVIKIEAETVDRADLPEILRASGAVDAPQFVQRVRRCGRDLCGLAAEGAPMPADFDRLFFDTALPPRRLDPRIQAVVDMIKRDPAAPISAEACADTAHLSFSRFLHLFKQEVGTPFRSFRAWKRARALLHYVTRDASLTHVALDTGYPDSTHFSHSIRQVYGLKPKDIFAGSRRLSVLADDSSER